MFEDHKKFIDWAREYDTGNIEILFQGDSSGHDYSHSIRVYNNACKMTNMYKSDWQIVSLAALLHDTDDYKLFDSKAYENARKIMKECKIENDKQERVINIIKTVSYKGGNSTVPLTIEGQIVQDADRLDAIGAIGIARIFAYGGRKGHKMYDPSQGPKKYLKKEDYKTYEGTVINHFYEKLLLLEDMMNGMVKNN